MFPPLPLREAEALLLSTAWFADIYLDISRGLGTISTVSEFSSVDHSFSGLWAQDFVDHLKFIYQLKITCIMCFMLVVVTFQWVDILLCTLCILRKNEPQHTGWLVSCYAWLCRCPTPCPQSPINPPNTPSGPPSRTASWVIPLPHCLHPMLGLERWSVCLALCPP